MPSIVWRCAFLQLVVSVGVACGGGTAAPLVDGGLSPDAGIVADDGGATDGGIVTGTGTLTVTVARQTGLAEIPGEGATAALDRPGGGRTELTADATGTVVFDDLHWHAGAAAVTAYLPNFGLVSRVGVKEADGAVKLVWDAYDPRSLASALSAGERVSLTGTAQQMASEAHVLLVSCPHSWQQKTGPQ